MPDEGILFSSTVEVKILDVRKYLGTTSYCTAGNLTGDFSALELCSLNRTVLLAPGASPY
jgi:hypothetical protein